MKNGYSTVVNVEFGLIYERSYLANGRVFRRPASWVRCLPGVRETEWTETMPIPGTKAAKRIGSQKSES